MTIAESNESKGFDLEHILWYIFNAYTQCSNVCMQCMQESVLHSCSAYFLYMLDARYLFSAKSIFLVNMQHTKATKNTHISMH